MGSELTLWLFPSVFLAIN